MFYHTTAVPLLSTFFSYVGSGLKVGPLCCPSHDCIVILVAQASTSGTGQFFREGVRRVLPKRVVLPALVVCTQVEQAVRQPLYRQLLESGSHLGSHYHGIMIPIGLVIGFWVILSFHAHIHLYIHRSNLNSL
jgi:hypothetical protein